MPAFSPPRTTEPLPGKRFSASSRSSRWSKVDVGRYAPMRGIIWLPETTLQLPTLVARKRAIHTYGRYCNTSMSPPGIPQPRWKFTWSRISHTPGCCDSTPCPVSSSPSRAWGCSYLAWQHKLPLGGRSRGCPKYCISPVWVPGGRMDGAMSAVAPSEFGNRQAISIRWSIWPLFYPCHVFFWFGSSTSRKCTILPPVKITSAHVVYILDANWDNKDVTTGPTITAANRWGLMVLGPSRCCLPRIWLKCTLSSGTSPWVTPTYPYKGPPQYPLALPAMVSWYQYWVRILKTWGPTSYPSRITRSCPRPSE